MRDAFIFYRSSVDAGKCIEDEADRLMFFEAIINYALDGVEPELNGIISGIKVPVNKTKYWMQIIKIRERQKRRQTYQKLC